MAVIETLSTLIIVHKRHEATLLSKLTVLELYLFHETHRILTAAALKQVFYCSDFIHGVIFAQSFCDILEPFLNVSGAIFVIVFRALVRVLGTGS